MRAKGFGYRKIAKEVGLGVGKASHPCDSLRDSKESVGMSKDATDLKYPMVDLITVTIISLMYLNVLTAMNLSLLSAPWIFVEASMKGLESGSVVQ
jgi:hypothetical protein